MVTTHRCFVASCDSDTLSVVLDLCEEHWEAYVEWNSEGSIDDWLNEQLEINNKKIVGWGGTKDHPFHYD